MGVDIMSVLVSAMPRLMMVVFFVLLFLWILGGPASLGGFSEGGFGWTEATVFGWHALLLSFFAVLFNTESILVFRNPILPLGTNWIFKL